MLREGGTYCHPLDARGDKVLHLTLHYTWGALPYPLLQGRVRQGQESSYPLALPYRKAKGMAKHLRCKARCMVKYIIFPYFKGMVRCFTFLHPKVKVRLGTLLCSTSPY